jgi:hypothetical protein
MVNKFRLIALIILCVFTFRSHADDFKVLDLEYSMPIDVPWIKVISTNLEWLEFYFDLLAANGIDVDNFCDPQSTDMVECSPPPPPVDFEYNQIIVGGLGIRYQDASRIVVSEVDSIRDDKLNINILNANPSDECVTTTLAVINHPIAAIAVLKSDKPINVTVEDVTLHCR